MHKGDHDDDDDDNNNNNNISTMNSDNRIAATLYSLRTYFMSGI